MDQSVVENYNVLDGDVLDISDILIGYDPLHDAIEGFVQLTQNNNDTIVSIDVDGGGDSFASLAIISNAQGLDIDTLIQDGNMIV